MSESPNFVVRLSEAPAGAPLGGKARALAHLIGAGFPVPDGLVVLPSAFGADGSLGANAALELAGKLAAHHPHESLFAVRSSASDEDGGEHSFAGQLDTFLDTPRADVAERVAKVAASACGERVLAYRRERGLAGGAATAVLIQPMIRAHCAGVAFGCDPVSGRRGTVVVAAVAGTGEKLVSGETDAHTWRIHADGTQTEVHETGEARVVDAARATDIAGWARRCGRHFGRPQDIEWAWDDAGFVLLQSRPVTTLGATHDPDGAFGLWDNSNIAESYNGITTPLTYSFARYIYEEVYKQFLLLAGGSEETVREHGPAFSRMLGLIGGRIYYDLLAWNELLALLPGFAFNRKAMEGMMGVSETMPPEGLRALDALRPPKPGFRETASLIKGVAALALQLAKLPRTAKDYRRRLDEALAVSPDALAAMRLDELMLRYRELERRLLHKWDAPLVNDFFAMVFFGLLGALTKKWIGEEYLHNDLVGADGEIVSAEPAKRMLKLAALAAPDSAFVELLRSGSPREALAAVARRSDFNREYAAYLDRFADRCLEELKLETETLRDDPMPLLRSVGELASRMAAGETAAGHGDVAASMRAAAEAKARAALRGKPLRAAAYSWVLRMARRRVRDRENLRFERTRLFGRVRLIFLEIGRRLNAAGHLAEPRDIFYLTVDEIKGFVEGTAVTTNLRGLVALRKEEFAGFRERAPVADRFHTWGAVHDGNRFRPTRVEEPATGPERRGLGCSPGVARGRVRVVLDPRGARVERGEILVAPRTDPGWILLFPPAAGLVVEHGSLLSHSAIVSRELGLPCVVSVPRASQWLRDGDLVELDGSTGVVRLLERFTPDTLS